MNVTDEQLEADWKPNGRRPQSTIARSFSQELMDIFRIENSVADLDEKVNQRKAQINSQTSELEQLEARIREMEARLKGQAPPGANGKPASPRTQRPPVGNAFDNPNAPPAVPKKDQQQQQKYGGSSRPPQQAVPGQLPPTPVGSEGEYELVSRLRVVASSGRPSSAHPHPAASRPSGSKANSTTYSSSVEGIKSTPSSGDNSGSVKSMLLSESASLADFVVVAGPDGDGDRF
ncbi:hypothetical protein QBC46DRAFT_151759 [Diplogelasinospora grovesii]|uniref:Uncharacterized protein n=1 Tax=Diplogelasinospora grovesii TaxID=303347 RepID=A0AAN6N672_9PEZI|nr:hypothetical protein QBC46DRAFT_151759 [Diplogelasinospora grovesii]